MWQSWKLLLLFEGAGLLHQKSCRFFENTCQNTFKKYLHGVCISDLHPWVRSLVLTLVKPLKIVLLSGEICFYIQEQFKLCNVCFKILKTTLVMLCDISMRCCPPFWGGQSCSEWLTRCQVSMMHNRKYSFWGRIIGLAESLLFASQLCKNVAPKRMSSLWVKECRAEPVPSSGHQLDILKQPQCWKQ